MRTSLSWKPTVIPKRPLPFAAACTYMVLLVLGMLDFSGTVQAWQVLRHTSESGRVMIHHIADARRLAQRNRAMLMVAMQEGPLNSLQVAEIENNIDSIDAIWSSALPLINDTQEGWLSSTVASQRLQYLHQGLLPVLDALRASGQPASYQALASKALSLYEPFDQSLVNLASYASARTEREQAAAEMNLQSALLNFFLLTASLLLLSTLLATLAFRSIATPQTL